MFTSEPMGTKAVQLERDEELVSDVGRPCIRYRQHAEVHRRRSELERSAEAAWSKSRSSSRCQDPEASGSKPFDTKEVQGEQEEAIPSETSCPCSRQEVNLEMFKRIHAPERHRETNMSVSSGYLDPKAFAPDTPSMLSEQLEGFSEGLPSASGDIFTPPSTFSPNTTPKSQAHHSCWRLGVIQNAGSPLLLRLCGILPCGRFGGAYCYGMLLLAVSLVVFFGAQLVQAQRRIVTRAECPVGICLSFDYLSDVILAVGSFLGLLAMRSLITQDLLGTPSALLVRFAVEHDVATKWSYGTSWQSVYLAVLWVGSLAFRVVTVLPSPSMMEVLRAGAFVLSSLLFAGQVFSILHVSCLVCSLLDHYAQSIRATRDLSGSMMEWDRLVSLLRRVSRALDHGFLLVAILLCSFSEIVLHGSERIWQFMSNVLLAQSLVLLFCKAAEVTGYCMRLPSVVNSLDFGGDCFSVERHYLVEHITYSAAGFYVGEVRLTAAMALKAMHIGILAAFGILTKLTMA